MSNSTGQQINITTPDMFQIYLVKGLYGAFSVSPSMVFLYINAIMLFTLRSKSVFRETPRYLLLYNLLFADTFQLAMGQLLLILALPPVFLTHYTCTIIVLITITVTSVSPLNLAVMSLERYVAVCFPLRHSAIVTVKNTGVSIGVVWALSSIDPLIRVILLVLYETFSADQIMQQFCAIDALFHSTVAHEYDKAFTAITFISVGIVIVCSYFGVTTVARSASSDKASTTKARNTVLLHMIQLLLCLSTSLSGILTGYIYRLGTLNRTARLIVGYVFFIFIVTLPRCLSSLIYGLRDQTIRLVFLHHLRCALWTGGPSLTTDKH
ncbi:odorant receptor 131-2-like [Hypomesus transpacificus]|uniref:odorant receptor 131-2-like n=1 Tax=Hypomesus transpacificus TaxID=137520 RepID=UPI001F07EFA0|nr:odorant receptor 131-2-like [Hypomesus transpacificus]